MCALPMDSVSMACVILSGILYPGFFCLCEGDYYVFHSFGGWY